MPTINRRRIKPKNVPYKHERDLGRYYNTVQWKNLRKRYIDEHPFCEVCLANGRVVNADHVHHKVPFSSGKSEEEMIELLLDEENLMSVCIACHQEIHRKLRHSK